MKSHAWHYSTDIINVKSIWVLLNERVRILSRFVLLKIQTKQYQLSNMDAFQILLCLLGILGGDDFDPA